MKEVLIIEDDLEIMELISIHLTDLGCQLTKSSNGAEAYQIALRNQYDLIVLDLMLPGMDGVDVCKQLRANQIKTPIMMLTARSELGDKILGLEVGADDYLTKPFSIREFIARVKAILRRVELDEQPLSGSEQLDFGSLMIDVKLRKVMVNGKRMELTPKEFDLLHLLAAHPGRSYSRQELLNKVWGYEYDGYEHTVNSHINRLRTKVEEDANKPKFILTTWGVGYRFSDE